MKPTSLVKRALSAYQSRADTKWRIPPRIEIHPAGRSTSIYYLAPMEKKPSGGIKVIYKHVDLLNGMGAPAAVLHESEGFRCDWFQNETKVISSKSLHFRANDILVIPECYGPGLRSLPAAMRKVIFNQGPHHTFDRIHLPTTERGDPYTNVTNILGMVTVSNDGVELLHTAFPKVPIFKIRNFIDSKIFKPESRASYRRIGYIPSRRTAELDELIHLLRASGSLDAYGWALKPIQGMPEREVARALQDCGIFISLSERDGFGLPAAEAMACGSYVVGYTGGGGKEFFDSAYCHPTTDTTELFQGLLDAMALPEEARRSMGLKASEVVRGRYSEDGLKSDLLAYFGGLL
jgi:glycosyltransferase involved in cell wall biosynthesis